MHVRVPWWRHKRWPWALAVLAGFAIAFAAVELGSRGYDNTPEGAAQRWVDTMGDPDSSTEDLFANACASRRQEMGDYGAKRPGTAFALVLDEVTQISRTKAVAKAHPRDMPKHPITITLVKEDGVWKDCG